MDIGIANLEILTTGFKAAFKQAFDGAETQYKNIAMTVGSSGSKNSYSWLGQFPKLREWIGPRHVKRLGLHHYTIENQKYEDTISVLRTDIEDDLYSVYGPLFAELGRAAAEQPDLLIFELLEAGTSELCYDGQYFFDTDHPVQVNESTTISVSNYQAGAGESWYLFDTTKRVKPLIYQERIPFGNIVSKNMETDDNVFMNDEYIYGVRGRAAAGFGLWQLAFRSDAELNKANYAAARKAMLNMKGDEDRVLGIKPNLMIVSPDNEQNALEILNAERDDAGATNVWKGTCELIVTPYV